MCCFFDVFWKFRATSVICRVPFLFAITAGNFANLTAALGAILIFMARNVTFVAAGFQTAILTGVMKNCVKWLPLSCRSSALLQRINFQPCMTSLVIPMSMDDTQMKNAVMSTFYFHKSGKRKFLKRGKMKKFDEMIN